MKVKTIGIDLDVWSRSLMGKVCSIKLRDQTPSPTLLNHE